MTRHGSLTGNPRTQGETANAYVAKPVDLDRFLGAVRQIDEFFVQVVRLPRRPR